MRKISLMIGSIVVAVIVVTAIFFLIVWLRAYHENSNFRSKIRDLSQARQQSLHQHWEQIEADFSFLSRVEEFRAGHGGSDAGPLLNSLIQWRANNNASRFIHQFEKEKKVRLGALKRIEGFNDEIIYWESGRLDMLSLETFRGLEFSWLSEIAKYDYWELNRNSPLEYVAGAFNEPKPIPFLVDLLTWAKLRLIKSILDDKYREGIRETRWLAHLAYSTESYVGSLIALLILGSEANYYSLCKKTKFAQRCSEEPYAIELASRGKRALSAVAMLVQLESLPANEKLLKDNGLFRFGVCHMINETVVSNALLYPLLREHFREQYDLLKVLVKKSDSCRFVLAKLFLESNYFIKPKFSLHGENMPPPFDSSVELLEPYSYLALVAWSQTGRETLGLILKSAEAAQIAAQLEDGYGNVVVPATN